MHQLPAATSQTRKNFPTSCFAWVPVSGPAGAAASFSSVRMTQQHRARPRNWMCDSTTPAATRRDLVQVAGAAIAAASTLSIADLNDVAVAAAVPTTRSAGAVTESGEVHLFASSLAVDYSSRLWRRFSCVTLRRCVLPRVLRPKCNDLPCFSAPSQGKVSSLASTSSTWRAAGSGNINSTFHDCLGSSIIVRTSTVLYFYLDRCIILCTLRM